MDILSYILSKKYTDKRIVEIAGGFHYKGAVKTRAQLPTNAEIGDIYTVKFKDDGTTVWNAELVWCKYEGTNQWIELGPDYEADIAALKAGKQDKLTAGDNITITEDSEGHHIISSTGGADIDFDNQTIIKGADHKYKTAVGGWFEQGTVIFKGEGICDGTVPSLVLSNSLQKAIKSTDAVNLTVLSPVGTLEGRYGVAQRSGTLFLELDGILERYTLSFEDGAVGKQVTLAKSDGNPAAGSYEVTFTDTTEIYHPIDNRFLNIDHDTMALNSEGALTCISHGSDVEANVEITGDEDELLSLKVGDKVYQNLNYHPFPESFVTNKTLKEFGQSIVNYAGFATGCTWFGGIQCTDLPGNMMQCECKVTAIRDKISWARNIAIVEIYSSEVAPFYWHYNTDSWNGGTGIEDWKCVASIDESKLDSTAAIGDSYNVKVKKVSAPAGSFGWEFYTDKSGGGGEPDAYIKDAAVDNEKLTLTKKDSSTVELDISGKVDKPNEPVVGQGLNVPYFFEVNYAADKVTVKDYTVDLLNKSKEPQQFSVDINCATQTNAGLMSANDKKNIDEMLPAYPTDTDAEYILALKYEDGAWVKYWKEIANKSDVVKIG